MIILIIFLLSILSGILYRLGGAGKLNNSFDFLRNTKARDIGCNVVVNSAIFILLASNGFKITPSLLIEYLLSIGFLLASLSTYWKKKGTNGNYFTWAVTGFFYGLSAIPFIFHTNLWLVFTIRTVILTLFIMLWWKKHPQSIKLFNHVCNGAQIEEFGRGFMLALTTLLFLL